MHKSKFRKAVSKHSSKRQFRKGAKTRALNLRANPMRGGFRI